MEVLQQSLANFKKELQARINVLSSSTISQNIDNNKQTYAELAYIISQYTEHIPVTVEVIKEIPLSELALCLVQIGEPKEQIKYLISRASDEEYLELITKKINEYFEEYHRINENQEQMQNSKVTEYKKYLTLCEKKQDTLYEEITPLLNVMKSVSIDEEDKWHILKHIAISNNALQKNIADINMLSEVYETTTPILEANKEYIEKIKEYLTNKEIDIELLPTIAQEIASKNNSKEKKVLVTLIAMLLESLVSGYQDLEESEEKEEILSMISDLLFQIPPEPLQEEINYEEMYPIVKIAKEIVIENLEFYKNTVQEEEEHVLKYLDTSITELKDAGYTSDEAIDLKKLPLLKTMRETLETMDQDPEENEKRSQLLEDLVEVYYNLLNKQEEIKRIN